MTSGMTSDDVVGLIGSAVACVTLLLRRNMLRGHFATWYSASWPVQASLVVLAIYMGMVSASILSGVHATTREAFAYAVLGAVSLVMVVNLDQSGRVEAGS